MASSAEHVIVVALEDLATAGIVAAGAAQLAMSWSSPRLVLTHVLDDHLVANGFFGLTPSPAPVVESAEEGAAVLALAEAAIRAEFTAKNVPVPPIARQLGEGRPGATIAQIAADSGAEAIVVGARRPHAFGRMTHPNVCTTLKNHTRVPVHVVALQAAEHEARDTTTS